MHHTLIFNLSSYQPEYRRSLGGHRIASWLREQGWDAEVIDFIEYWTLEELQELCRNRISGQTVFVGCSTTFSYSSPLVKQLFEWIKVTWPNVKLIVGGQSLGRINIPADWYIEGYGELAINEVIGHLLGNNKRINYTLGINGKKFINAIHSYPAYPMANLRVQYETRDFIHKFEWLGIEIGRGCKFKCDFCAYPILGVKGDYSRAADDFKQELQDNYDQWGVTNYYAADETFNDRTEKIIKFADVVEQLDFNPTFMGFIRPDLLVSRRDDWEHLLRMGFVMHHYGIESLNWESARSIGKGMPTDKLTHGLLEAKSWFQKYAPYHAVMSFIVGLPHETKETINNTFNWVETNWQDQHATFYPLNIVADEHRKSNIGENWAERGYHIKPLEQIVMPDDSLAKTNNLPWHDEILGLHWANDHMDLQWAIETVNTWNATKQMKHPGSGWAYGQVMPYTNLPIADFVKTPADKINYFIVNYQTKKLIKQYINSKINYR